MVSDLEFGSINYKEAVRYIAANKSEVECSRSDLRRVLPTRHKGDQDQDQHERMHWVLIQKMRSCGDFRRELS